MRSTTRISGWLISILTAVNVGIAGLLTAATTAQATATADSALIWLGSPIDGRWSSYEGANSHHTVFGGDWAIDLETPAGQPVNVYAAPRTGQPA